jgi:phage repressor protein C with HTH and peptisase S24 domain
MKNIGRTIADHRKAMGFSQAKLAEELTAFGLSPSAASVSSWEKNVSIPNAVQFLGICKILGIKDIYSEFIDNDTALMSGLNTLGRQKAAEYIALLRLSPDFTETDDVATEITRAAEITDITELPAKAGKAARLASRETGEMAGETSGEIRLIRIYDLPASAGPGEFLDGDSYTEIEADNTVPAKADFGTHVNGDSMEPVFTNGQMVWVERCDSVNDGEIGLFSLNGSAFIKKFRLTKNGAELVSLNPAYKPIRILEGDSLYTFGRVLK